MTTIDSYPHAIREIANEWIPLADGTRLAARIWMPADAATKPVPPATLSACSVFIPMSA